MENHHAMSLFLIALSVPVIIWGVRMNRWHKMYFADVLRRTAEGRAQLDGRTMQYWTDNLGRSASSLYRYRRLLRAEAAGESLVKVPDNRPLADRFPDPEAYAVRVIAFVALISLLLASSVLSATGSVAWTLGLLALIFGSGLLAARPLLTHPSERIAKADTRKQI